ncbi:MAG: DUF4281 domain-containing protein [Burkholderiales bacterium]|nr:DUF4281 domain-containing protein [Burkholderiales bacterium]
MTPMLSVADFSLLFRVANGLTLAAWIGLIVLPRWAWLRQTLRGFIVGLLCPAYTVLIGVFFFGTDGGFSSLAAVQQLFTSAPVALAGWLHYLAFDLFVGLWIAKRGDEAGISRWLQAPVLATTFMFGPIGLLLFAALTETRRRWVAAP